MGETSRQWVGKDEHFGVPSMKRPDALKPRSWDLRAIAAVGRPHDSVASPDGRYVSSVFDLDTSDIWVIPVSGEKPQQVTTGRELAPYWEDDPAPWAPSGDRLAYTAKGFVWVVPARGGFPKKVTKGSAPVWINDDELVVSIERDDETRLARVAVDDPWPVAITEAGHNVSGASVSVPHSIVAYVVFPKDDLQSSDIWLHHLDTGANRRLTNEPGMHDRCPRVSPDGSLVAFVSERSGWYEVYRASVDGSTLARVTSESADMSGLDWHPGGGSLVAVRTKEGNSDLVIIDMQTGGLEVVSSGGEWSTPHWVGDSIAAIHESATKPPSLVTLTRDGTETVLLDQVPASVRMASHVQPEGIRYESFDGLEIHGFLMRPDDSKGGLVPAVVYPHGGPTSAYTDSWDGHAQYFVDKGYAWLAINFRGSTGYGRDFERANHGVWGVADTQDCLAAADYLGGLDWVDSNRIAIFGASYGSYMALAALARDPQHRFACGAAKYGDSDIATSWAQGDRGGREDLERMMGRPADDREAYRAGSPLWTVDQISKPILVAHGEKDIRVHPDQSRQLVDELLRHQKTFEYITYPTEGHGLLNAEPQVHFYKRLERFLDWYLM